MNFTDILLEYLGDRCREEETKDSLFIPLILPKVLHTGLPFVLLFYLWNCGPLKLQILSMERVR